MLKIDKQNDTFSFGYILVENRNVQARSSSRGTTIFMQVCEEDI